MTASDAEVVALRAVAWIFADDVLRDRFVALTGCGSDEVRLRLAQPAFLGAVLDFLLGNDADVIAFAEHAGLAPETMPLARSMLP
ncbi:DUF3572 domain-containing protein [Telmatospirillum siberiense]|nr:DUF3572 domain-containing protein [Telmatospirillum siberiense]